MAAAHSTVTIPIGAIPTSMRAANVNAQTIQLDSHWKPRGINFE
jgi:hypothetical protein